ncbi:glycosyltransferase family 2 protein [Exercitatus varius]|uniref:glycosyltransferase family 2 protein n=1 Tax=Exercitatus varius TaxID=67857 RepID=UPI00294AD8A6|nr:glycosyltransferase [Exercitatus varius]MDG2941558.1 glycosyltransferase [Exercitatus varius]
MKFSVLMSLYFKEKPEYLRASLQSLADQTVPADEIILVLDGPITAELENVLDEFQTKLPLKTVPLAHNVGLGKALNEGIKAARNEWLFRMDTDDICKPERFAKQVEYIEQHPDVVMFSTQIAEFDEDPNVIIAERRVPTEYQDIVKFNQMRSPFNHMTVAYKKSLLQEVGGYQHHMFLEDYNLWNRIIATGHKVGNLPDVLLLARTAGNAMFSRRRGWVYAKSEWKLYRLKQRLKIQGAVSGFMTFLARTLPRLMPVSVVKMLYKFMRK